MIQQFKGAARLGISPGTAHSRSDSGDGPRNERPHFTKGGNMSAYQEFLAAKQGRVESHGFAASRINARLFPFQVDCVRWAVSLGRAALFADTGLGKTAMQLDWAHIVAEHTGKPVLILAPLAVGAQTVREALKFGIENVRQVREPADIGPGINVTNYERVEKFDPSLFGGVVLDESSILKNYTGHIKRYLLKAFADTRYRLACTATPAPNDHLELGNHAEFLGVMSSHKMIARWFISDQSTAGTYRLKGHAIVPFWNWVTSWARCVGKPSDIDPTYDDSGYDLPPLNVHRHTVRADRVTGAADGELFRQTELSATSMHREKRLTAGQRAARVAEIVNAEPNESWLVWVETNYDGDAVRAVLGEAVDVRGSMPADKKAARLLGFVDEGGILLTKPGIAGMGMNYQHCARMVFNGLSFSYERYYQAIRRCWRFGQVRSVECHVVMADTESSIWSVIDRKSADHEAMKLHMFKASRRAMARTAVKDPYNPTCAVSIPTWLKEKS